MAERKLNITNISVHCKQLMNMRSLAEPLTFTANLTADFKRQALVFSREQKNTQKARQIYLNTLAVQAVHFYCECIGIETDLAASDSWDSAMRTLINVADLAVKGKGKLECLPIIPSDEFCHVALAVGQDRLGYVVVMIDEENDEARLVGFSATAIEERLSISQLPSIEGLINALVNDIPEEAQVPQFKAPISDSLIRLGNWFQSAFDEFWQEPEFLLAASYRGTTVTQEPESLPFQARAKLLTIGAYKVALVVQVSQISDVERDIILKIHPHNGNILPEGLSIQLFDGSNHVVMETQTQKADNFRSLHFQISAYELFSLKVEINNLSIVEQFLS
jgi:hypothetical protein